MQQTAMTQVHECIYTFIGDAGAVTPEELVALLRLDDFSAYTWLRSQVAAGYLYRDEFGAYGTSCPGPRIGC